MKGPANDHSRPAVPEWADYCDRRSARRAAARRYHPDVGGSADEISAAFSAIDAVFMPCHDYGDGPIVIVVRGQVVRRLRMRLRRWYRHRRRHYVAIY